MNSGLWQEKSFCKKNIWTVNGQYVVFVSRFLEMTGTNWKVELTSFFRKPHRFTPSVLLLEMFAHNSPWKHLDWNVSSRAPSIRLWSRLHLKTLALYDPIYINAFIYPTLRCLLCIILVIIFLHFVSVYATFMQHYLFAGSALFLLTPSSICFFRENSLNVDLNSHLSNFQLI